ncbi:transcriptional regulator AsnC family protein [Vibrio ichthyoenteri ATCC 700023]|uniref:Transcriptional regulator AsnC family protein n=1 Tax=Vibrio ichthyoenteri ATCC 700023 TaxID=870968 RepID=F9RXZ3_9VIBR|nr:Lrp/AsnC family transcriptional regulator [Vibrio ichthyoenteri]EGU47142.1 transcriptional regulator AsnC family protein [Vibrio ichthyoenteri ATCC 700023]
MRLDRYDIKILQILQHDGRITKSQLAQQINLSVSPCWERVKKLEQAGIIEGYGAQIKLADQHKYTTVLVEISLKQHNAQAFKHFEQQVLNTEQVLECYATGGGIDYVVKFKCSDIDQYQRCIDQWLESNVGIERYYTYIVTKIVKQPKQATNVDSPLIKAELTSRN